VDQKFTGKERDAESGLDYFGARYFSSAQGRFTSPDKPFADQHPEDPQTWNLYSYVRNNPLSNIDADGRQTCAVMPGVKCAGIYAHVEPDPHAAATAALAVAGAGAAAIAFSSGAGELSVGAMALYNWATGFFNSPGGQATVQTAGDLMTGSQTPSVWSLAPAARGLAIEAQLGANLPQNFPTIDRFADGIATSIKSLDLNASSYQKAGTLMSTLTGYIDKVAGFNGGSVSGVTITSGQVAARALELAVPGAGTAAQQNVIKAASQYADKIGVQLIVKQVN
jgi:RHS repeat-associated protein